MLNLEHKKILLIGVGLYDYEQVIADALCKYGAQVTRIVSDPAPLWSRILRQIGLCDWSRIVADKARQRIIRKSGSHYDQVLIFKGADLNDRDIAQLKNANPEARFILYLWDSLERHANRQLLLDQFDDIWSFDKTDCENHPELKFRPLFYRTAVSRVSRRFRISFIGWMHSDRLEILRSVRKQLEASGQSYFLKLYMGRFSYLIARYIKHTLHREDRDLLTFTPIDYDEFIKVCAASEIVLDIAHPRQTGLTMRTIEAISLGCHLLTTNRNIASYPQINPLQYSLFDRRHPDLNCLNGIQSHQGLPTQEFMDYFSLDAFIETITGKYGNNAETE